MSAGTAFVSAATVYSAGVMEVLQEQAVTVTYDKGSLLVSGGEGYVLEVVSLTGKRVLEVKIDSPAQKIELNLPKGCYIVKVGDVVRKISVR